MAKKGAEGHSKMYATVKRMYDTGKWSKAKVHNAVTNPESGPFITAEEYKEITGEDYEPVA